MKYIPVVILTTILGATPALATDLDARVAKSREAAKDFQAALQTELQAAIKAGGAVNAIAVCNTKAPAIAKDKSQQLGLSIGRTSLKVRNSANAPDAWEQKVLELFELRKKNGEDPGKIEFYEVADAGGKKMFRYMKAIAIPEGAPCLACHGQSIDPAVQAKLKALYPADKATGFKTGDLRGAFTISQPL
jgi:hypothetical protein